MIKGTTPTHIFKLPFGTETIKTIQIIYAQNGETKLTKGNSDCVFDGNTVTVKLTQEDTFSFADGVYVEIQVRVLLFDGNALASRVMRVRCNECLSDEVIS